jgi:hypothetical protein
MISFTADNGGRRSGIDRRRFSYTAHIPERRYGEDRRSGIERRKVSGAGITVNHRSIIDRRIVFKEVSNRI